MNDVEYFANALNQDSLQSDGKRRRRRVQIDAAPTLAWSDDGVLAMALSNTVYGAAQSIFISHTRTPDLCTTLTTPHTAPISMLRFAPSSSGRLLLSIDSVLHMFVWRCAGAANQWQLVRNLGKSLLQGVEFCLQALWLRCLPGEPLPPARSGDTLTELVGENCAGVSRANVPCCVLLSRSRLIAVYERAEEQRWGFATEMYTMPHDTLIGDLVQVRDNNAVKMLCVPRDRSVLRVFRVLVDVCNVGEICTQAESQVSLNSIPGVFRCFRFARDGTLAIYSTCTDTNDNSSTHWLHRWEASSETVKYGAADVQLRSWRVAAQTALPSAAKSLTAANSESLVIALSDSVQIAHSQTLQLLPVALARGANRAILSPYGTCVLLRDAQRSAIVVREIESGCKIRAEALEYAARCYVHALQIGSVDFFDLDCTLCALGGNAAASVADKLKAPSVAANCAFPSMVHAAVSNLLRLQRPMDSAFVQHEAVLQLQSACDVFALVSDKAVSEVYYREIGDADTGFFVNRTLLLVEDGAKVVQVLPLLDWVVEFSALLICETLEFVRQQPTLPAVPPELSVFDAPSVAAAMVARANCRLPLLRILFDYSLIDQLTKLLFAAGALGDDWSRAGGDARRPACANAADMKRLFALLRMLHAAVCATRKILSGDGKPLRGAQATVLANGIAKQIRDQKAEAQRPWLMQWMAQRSEVRMRESRVKVNRAANATSPVGLLMVSCDMLPRGTGVLMRAQSGAMSQFLQSIASSRLLRIDCITKAAIKAKQKTLWQCTRCKRTTLPIDKQDDIFHLSWRNCCPICFGSWVCLPDKNKVKN